MVSFLRQGSGVSAVRRGATRWLAVMGLAASAVAVTIPSSGVQAKVQPASVDTSSLARGTQQLTNFVGYGASAYAASMTPLGSKTLFITDDGVHGTELWVTDGTTNGTKLLKDIAPGASSSTPFSPTQIAVMGNKAYFAASSGELDHALWSTDGTTEGTQLVHQFTVDYDDCPPSDFAVLNSRLYFAADDVDSGCELWTSDGTDAGTQLVKDVVTGGGGAHPTWLTTVGSKIVYSANDADYDNELWVTDGTASGTQRLANINTNPDESSDPTTFVSFSNGAKVAFISDRSTAGEVWVTDGTSAGTFRDSPSGFEVHYLITSGSAIHYSGFKDCSAHSGVCNILYSSNGTGSAILHVEEDESKRISDLTVSNGIVYFSQYLNGVLNLYRLNGGIRSAALSSLSNPFVYPSNLFAAGGLLFFNAFTDGSFKVFVSDGTAAGTNLLKDFEPGSLSADLFGASTVGNRTLLSVQTDQYGIELWVSDGTPNGTNLLKDINAGKTGAGAQDIAVLGNKAFYGADANSSGDELWSTDIVTGVTTLVSDINQSGSSSPTDLTVIGNKIVFVAYNDDVGDELFVTDGTTAGTQLLKDINQTGASYIGNFVTMGGKAYFTANDVFGAALWVTDGTTNGTQVVSGAMGYLDAVVATTDKVFFLAINGLKNVELWVTDGSSTPTMLYVSSGSDTYSLPELVAANNYVVFAADNGVDGREIWKSDGTVGGTAMIRDINAVSDGSGGTDGSDPFGLTAMGAQVIFAASDGTGAEPWITDGTSNGTRKIKDINPYGHSMSEPYQDSANSLKSVFTVTASSARAFFFASDDEHGEELWATDGTASGTYLVKDIVPGEDSNSNYELVSVGERVFFGMSDFSISSQYSSQFGNELWTSDGSEGGTYMVRNIAPDSQGSFPVGFHAIGNRLLFVADAYNGRGQQLFITDGSRSSFTPLAQPVRILDTRTAGDTGKVGALDGSGAAYTLQVNGVAGVPFHGVAAVSLNVTAVATEAGSEGGYVTVYPCGTKPDASNLNFVANQIIPNAVVAPVSDDGKVCFYVYGKAHLLADVSGWLPTGGFTALAQPERLLNTRPDGEAGKVGALDGTGTSYTLQVTGVKGIPASGVSAVAMNVTAVATEAGNEGGYVTVYPCGTPPDASNLNFKSNQLIPNGVIAPVSADGKVCFYVYGKAHLLADVSGWLPAGGCTALAQPYRLLNTRTAGDAGKIGEIDGSGVAYTLQVAGQGGLPSAGIGSIALNVTVVDGLVNEYGGYVTVYPCGTRPDASNLNFTTGQIVPNAVIAPVSADGKVCIYVYGKSHILVDASGYLAS